MGNGIILSPAAALKSRLKAERLNLALMLMGFAPLLFLFFSSLWNRPAYQFFPLAFVGFGLLAHRALTEFPIPFTYETPRVLFIIVGLLCSAACFLWSPWLAYFSFVLALAAVLWRVGGKKFLLALVPGLLLLLTVLPPPFSGDQKLTLWLRSLAMDVCAALLDCFQIVFARDGNTLLLPKKTLLVEEACSGINSFILCNVLCLFWFLWQRRPWLWLLLAMPVTSLFVVLGNIVRITAGALAFSWFQIDLLSGWKHETFGLILLLGYCGLILSLEQLLLFLNRSHAFKAAPARPASLSSLSPLDLASPGGQPISWLFRFAGVYLLVISLSCLAVQLHRMGKQQLVHHLSEFKVSREFHLSLPKNMDGWERINQDNGDLGLVETLGVHSTRWRFQNGGLTAGVAVDYPLDGFHNVAVCYSGNGWKTISEVKVLQSETREDLHAIRLKLQQDLRHGLVFHCVVNERGAWLERYGEFDSRFAVSQPTGFRIQLVINTYAELSPQDEHAALAFFLQARKLLVPQIVAEVQKNAGK